MKIVSAIVWDPIVRLFHWSLLVAYAVAYFTQEQNYELHLQAGYFILALIAVRFVWGFIGTQYAKFKNFLYRPTTIWYYVKSLFNKQPQYYRGHNPAAGLMVFLLLICLLTICISGIALDAAENRSGPFADTQLFLYTDYIITLHIVSTYISIGLIALHVPGVLISSLLHKENLVRAMITGKKPIKK